MDTEFTYTLRDLETTDFPGTSLAVIGHPITHSISPAMHNAALSKLRGRDSRFLDWKYYRFDIAPVDFARALPLFHKRNFLGLNLTIPHKVEAMKLIKGVSPDGERMGAVNTLVWNEFGYDGFNTDGYGLKQGIESDLGFQLNNATVVLLGSGGAARAAAVQCILDGCKRLYIGNRNPDRLEDLMGVVAKMPGGDCASAFALKDVPKGLDENGLIINATSLGLKEGDPPPITLDRIPSSWKVYDMIYNPPETSLMQIASDRGMATANGLSMLVNQGARALSIWSGAEVPVRSMMSAACHALKLPPRYD